MYVLFSVVGRYVCLCYGILWVSDGAFKIRIEYRFSYSVGYRAELQPEFRMQG